MYWNTPAGFILQQWESHEQMWKRLIKQLAFAFGLTGEKTCACGRVWELVKYKTIETDSESIECKCGRTLKRWNGACFWIPRLARDIDD